MKQIQLRHLILTMCITLLTGYLSSSASADETYWMGRVVSVQGEVYAKRAGETQWKTVKINDTYRSGDLIQTQERSRAAIVLRNDAMLRLDEKTSIIFSGDAKKEGSLLDLITGALHLFSRFPRGLRILTPFVNAAVEGTEFFIRVGRNQTLLSVFEGRVAATNERGDLILSKGQSAVVRKGKAPIPRILARPRDAVQWALYYPPVLEYRPADFSGEGWQTMVRRSIEFYWNGNLSQAFSSLEGIPEDIRDPRFFTYRAGLLLSVGRVDEAGVDIERALSLDLSNSQAFALRSVIAMVQNEKDEALHFARKGVESAPKSSAVRVALSYAQQAGFDLDGALESLMEAVELDPENALAWSRLSELWLSFGDIDKAADAAGKAVALNPNLERTQTVMGFSYLTRIKIRDAKKAFLMAIELDQTAPLPRLGLGLAKIREGDLKAGRAEIEIAAGLDPDNSLIRGYLGKAYYEEKRDKPAKDQFAIAKELDPQDPTAWFYDAIRKQSRNRPVEALQDLERSIELNENRAVYRSRLLLDQDLAARSSSLGRIYNDLGFQQLALAEGWGSLNADPANYSAHRFLADSYANLPRHHIARVSELLQSQLLQPINITPVQPSLAESNLSVLEGAGPSDPSFNEFNPLFIRNRLALQTSGVVGGNDSFGDEIVQSGLWGRLSYSLGQFHYETDGFRENNDQDQDIYNVFTQVALSHKTNVQAEYRYTDTETGDLGIRFWPNVNLNLRQEERTKSIRLGFHHSFTPQSDLIASFIHRSADRDSVYIGEITSDDDGFLTEIQHLFRKKRIRVIAGMGHLHENEKSEVTTFNTRHTNTYIYSLINYPESVTWTFGASADFFRDGYLDLDHDQFSPKIGITWNLFPATKLHAAAFRTFNKRLITNQTIEPTQVAGFNQFFGDLEATKAWRYGIGIDQKFSSTAYGGMEFSRRDLDVPFTDFIKEDDSSYLSYSDYSDWGERLVRSYIYWAPCPWISTSAEYQYERFTRDKKWVYSERFFYMKTQRLPLEIKLFCVYPGLTLGLKATYVDQKAKFKGHPPEEDQFWVVDASIGYRLPKRWCRITIEAKNLFDEAFKYQDTDTVIGSKNSLPLNPLISPGRLILARVTLAF